MEMLRHDSKLSTAKRPCPSLLGSAALEIDERLTRQGQKRSYGLAAREARPDEQAGGRFEQSQHMSGCESRTGMVRRLGASRDDDRYTAQITADSTRGTHRCCSALESADAARERRNAPTAEGLERVERSHRSAKALKRLQGTAIQRSAGVQHDLALPLRTVEPRQRQCNIADFAIGGGDKHDIAGEHPVRQLRVRLTCTNRLRGSAGVRKRTRNNRPDTPAAFAQAGSQRAAHTPCPDDGHAA